MGRPCSCDVRNHQRFPDVGKLSFARMLDQRSRRDQPIHTPSPQERSGDWSARSAFAVLTAGSAVLIALRLWIISSVASPFLFADETVGFGVARFLAGFGNEIAGPSGRPLLGLLLSPLAVATDDPAVLHRGALVLNVALGTSLVPSLYLAGRRMLKYRRSDSATIALAGSGTAAAMSYTVIAFPELLLTAITTIAVPVVWSRFERPDPRTLIPLAALFAALFSGAHPRGDALSLALVLTLVLAVARRQLGPAEGLGAAAAAIGASAVVVLSSAALNSRLYVGSTNASYSITEIVTDSIAEPSLLVRAGIGSVWYSVIATFGLAVLGIIAICRDIPRSDSRGTAAQFVALLVLGSFAASSLFVSLIMSGQGRVDSFAYGRYVEHLFPVLLLYAPAVWSLRWARNAAMIGGGAILAAGAVISRLAYESDFWTGPTLKTNIPMIWYLWEGADPIQPWVASVVGIGLVGIMMAALARERFRAVAIAALTLAGVGTAVALVRQNIAPYSSYVAEWRPAADALIAEEATDVAVVTEAYPGLWRHLIQFWADDVDFDHYVTIEDIGPDARWLLALEGQPLPVGRSGQIVHNFPDQDTVIWRLDP